MTDPHDPPVAGPGGEPGFRPSHVAPRDGMATWSAPDMARPSMPLDPLLPVQLLDRRGDWAHVLCSNGWAAWVDGRLLVSVPQNPPAAGAPLARTADPRGLLDRSEGEVRRYRQAAEELAAGVDGETFRQRTRGLRAGLVVDGEAIWLYDAEHERWCYSDGSALTTYAASHTPSSTPAPPGAEGPSAAPGTGAAYGAQAPPEAEAPPGTPPRPAQPPPTEPPPSESPSPDATARPQPPPPTQVVEQPEAQHVDRPEAQPGAGDPAGGERRAGDDGDEGFPPDDTHHPPTRFGDAR
ncbi:hypothetical protein [Streptomyces sp. NPDC048639]|uniref:hypothetical protein n=1 Tax=Streptomyces sp. NPDC048639 TaxID=3365581 RepID=UPI0037104BBE